MERILTALDFGALILIILAILFSGFICGRVVGFIECKKKMENKKQ